MSIKLFHPDATGCSVDGVSYEKGADGAFDVEDAHAAALMDHGFSTAAPIPAAPVNERKANPAQMTTEALEEEGNELGLDSVGMARKDLVQAVAAARQAKAKAARLAELEAKGTADLTEAELEELISLQGKD
jgi:hypothetical protein